MKSSVEKEAPTNVEASEPRLIEVRSSVPNLMKAYNFFSGLYSYMIAPLEVRSRRRGLELADVSASDRILEVAVGSGNAFCSMALKRGTTDGMSGVDLCPGMLKVTKKRMSKNGFSSVDLRRADARRLPFPDNRFDLVFNSYMVDLIPLAEIPGVLSEYKRVLRPGGRMILINMSKKDPTRSHWYEWFYRMVPAWFATFILGGCRPLALEHHVRTLGFVEVVREYHAFPMFCEILRAEKSVESE